MRPQGSLWRIPHQSCYMFCNRNCFQWVRLLWYRSTPDRTAVTQGPDNQIKLEAGAFITALSGKASKAMSPHSALHTLSPLAGGAELQSRP